MTKTLSQVRQMVGELGYFAPTNILSRLICLSVSRVPRRGSKAIAGWLSSHLRSEPASVFLSTLAGFSFTKQPQFFTSRAEFFTKSLDFYYQAR